MTEYDFEPIRGLPGNLPEGEQILWQGAPDWRSFARSALFTRWVLGYFAVLTMLAIANGSLLGMAGTIIAGLLGLGLLSGFAWLVARTTVYTVTDRRVVLRIGIALNKCINLPLKLIGAADLRGLPGGTGDIALTLSGSHRLGYAMLWPHARPFRFGKPQPMLRSVPDAARVAEILAKACAKVVPTGLAASTTGPAMASPAPLREAAA